MGFIRFTGEFVIYYTIIALGGGGQTGLSWVMFDAISIDLSALVEGWALPGGAMGAVLICAWLVDGRRSVIESIAPDAGPGVHASGRRPAAGLPVRDGGGRTGHKRRPGKR